MTERRSSDSLFCRLMMATLVETMQSYAVGKASLLKRGADNPVQEDMGKGVLALRAALQSDAEIAAFEMVLYQVQQDILGALFALVDGSAQPPGWPEELRLVNMDTDEVVCPEGLQWAFGIALAENPLDGTTSDTT